MKTILSALAIFSTVNLSAQYYYNDIIGTQETNRQMKNYLAQKVRTVTATGFDQRGSKATNFSELQEIKEDGKALKISTITGLNKTVIYLRFDKDARIISSSDSSSAIESKTTYEYDAAGRVSRIKNTVRDSANDFNQTELHSWIYDAKGNISKMWRVINDKDSLEIRFASDEFGNTADEKTFRRGVETGVIYYYYDDKNQVTDIVRYNTKAKKLLPDMLFEYDDKGRVIQKITTTSNLLLGYLIWRYAFNENGLKSKEALFNNDKEMTGKIEYSYTFGN